MKSVNKPYRTAVFNALNGNLSYNGTNVPLYDELKSVHDNADIYVVFSTEQVSLSPYQGCWSTTVSLDLEIYYRSGAEATKDVLDSVEENIVNILFPTPDGTMNVVVPSGFNFNENWFNNSITITTFISPTQTILRKIVKISSIITQ